MRMKKRVKILLLFGFNVGSCNSSGSCAHHLRGSGCCVVLVPIISFICVECSILLNVQGNNRTGAAVFTLVFIKV